MFNVADKFGLIGRLVGERTFVCRSSYLLGCCIQRVSQRSESMELLDIVNWVGVCKSSDICYNELQSTILYNI